MRKPSISSSKLFQPLDLILGSVGAVRILRELALHGDLLSAAILARRTKLNRRGISEILSRLIAEGIVESVPSAGKGVIRLSSTHQLAPKLIALFEAEALRAPNLYRALRNVGKKSNAGLISIWLFGSSARRADNSKSDVDLIFVVPDKVSGKRVDTLIEQVAEVGDRLKLRLSPAVMTPSELRKLRRHNDRFRQALLDEGVVIFGSSPLALLDG